MSTPSYPASTLAKLFELTERRVRQLSSESIIPSPKDGKYDLTGSVRGYIRYLKKLAFSKCPEGTEEHELRMRILRAQAATAELDMQKETGESIPVAQAMTDWQNMALSFKARILAMPYRLACSIIGLTEPHEIEKIAKTLVKEALDELAYYDPRKHKQDTVEEPAAREKTVDVVLET
jgi:phage terminase Nu1 subunit (DNA packaging protein)